EPMDGSWTAGPLATSNVSVSCGSPSTRRSTRSPTRTVRGPLEAYVCAVAGTIAASVRPTITTRGVFIPGGITRPGPRDCIASALRPRFIRSGRSVVESPRFVLIRLVQRHGSILALHHTTMTALTAATETTALILVASVPGHPARRLGRVLSDAGSRVVWASEPDQARELASALQPDCILIDVTLGAGGGAPLAWSLLSESRIDLSTPI